jgi:hypothetical protein
VAIATLKHTNYADQLLLGMTNNGFAIAIAINKNKQRRNK